MAIQLVDLGELINDGTGDDLRTAFEKVNSNFEEVQTRLPDSISGVNLGSSGEGVFSSAVGSVLSFKKIAAGNNIAVSSNTTTISVAVDTAQELTLTGGLVVNSVAADSITASSAIITPNLVGDLDGNIFRLNTPIAISSVTESTEDFEPVIINALTISGNNSTVNGTTVITTTDGDGLTVISDQTFAVISNDRIDLQAPQVSVFGQLNATLYGNIFSVDGTVLLVDAINSVLRGTLIGSVEGNLVGNTSGTHTGAVFGDTTGYHVGDVLGNLVGNVTGNLNGSVTGNVTGNVTGVVTALAGSTLIGNVIGTVSDISNQPLSALSDVSSDIPLVGQSLVWSGLEWQPDTIVGGGGGGDLLIDGGFPTSIFDGTEVVIDGGGV
jgi:hypothetical protein